MRTLVSIIVIVSAVFFFRLYALNNTTIDTKNFSYWNKIEIYTLGWLMSTVAKPLYPEIAYEHQLLFNPGPDVIKHNDVFLNSTTVQRAIHRSKFSGKPVRLHWDASVYKFNPLHYWETRIALALNGAWLSTNGEDITIKVPVRYPKKAYAPLIGSIGFEEGLFWVLQEEGWYHPKTLTWRINGSKTT